MTGGGVTEVWRYQVGVEAIWFLIYQQRFHIVARLVVDLSRRGGWRSTQLSNIVCFEKTLTLNDKRFTPLHSVWHQQLSVCSCRRLHPVISVYSMLSFVLLVPHQEESSPSRTRGLETIRGLACLTLCFNCHRRKDGNSDSSDRIYGVAADTENSVYLAGFQYSSSSSTENFAVLKINAGGDLLWQWEVRLIL